MRMDIWLEEKLCVWQHHSVKLLALDLPCFTLRLLPIASSKTDGSYPFWANPNPAEVISLTTLNFGWAPGSTTGKSFNSFLTLIVHHYCIHWLPNSVTEEIIGTLFIGLLCIAIRPGYTQQSAYWNFENIALFQQQKTTLIQNMQLQRKSQSIVHNITCRISLKPFTQP